MSKSCARMPWLHRWEIPQPTCKSPVAWRLHDNDFHVGMNLNYVFAQEDCDARSKPLPAVQPLPNSFEAQTDRLISDLKENYAGDDNLLQAQG